LSVFVTFMMIAGATLVVLPDIDEGTAPVVVQPDSLATHVVISEVLYDDDGVDNHEFVELYNPTSSPIDISGWDIVPFNGAGFVELGVMTLPAGQSIPGYGFYLVAQWTTNPNDGTDGVDVTTNWDYMITSDCGPTGSGASSILTGGSWVVMQNGPDAVLLRDETDTYVDAFIWGDALGSYGFADEPFAADITEGSLERMSSAFHDEIAGNGEDNDDNSFDLRVRKSTTNGQRPQPQNTANATEEPSGSSVTYADHVVINEILYDCVAPEGTGEWVELMNPTSSAVSLNGWTINDGGLPFEGTWTFPNRVIGAGMNVTIAGDGGRFYQDHGYYADFEAIGDTPSENLILSGDVALSNAGETLELRNSGSTLIDVVIYEASDANYPLLTPINFPIGDNDSIKRNPQGAENETAPDNENFAMYWVEDESPTPDTSDVLPPTVTGVTATVTPVSCLVEWATVDSTWPEINPAAKSEISYKAGSNPDTGGNITVADNQKKEIHEMYLTGLAPSTTYYFLIRSEDGLGHVGYSKNGGSYYQFTTLAAESVAPSKLSGPSVDMITDDTARVYWTTNEASTSLVYYGTSQDSLISTAYNPTLSTANEAYLYGLAPSTTYYYAISSSDPSGNYFYDDNGLSPAYQFNTFAVINTQFYVGDMHSHTGYSDGAVGTDPQDAYVYARDSAQIDILAVTDHTHYLDATEYSDTITMADAETTEGPGGFIAIAGQEFGLQPWHNHFNIYDADVRCPLPYDTFDVPDLYTWMTTARSGGIAPGQFNHPGQGDDYDSLVWTQNGEDVMGAFEIYNAGYGSFEGYYSTFMGAGWHVGVGGNTDNHDPDGWGDSTLADGKSVPLTCFQLDYLSRDNVLDNFREGKSYALLVNRSGVATDDYIKMEFEIAGQPVSSELTLSGTINPYISLSTNSVTLNDVFLYEDGVQISAYNNMYTNSFVWTPEIVLEPGEHWYYVKATQTDGVGKAISSPIWITVPAMSQPPSIGPNVHTIIHTPSSPTSSDDVLVTAIVEEGDNPINNVLLMYSVNAGAYLPLVMADDGIYPDTISGDGIYAGLITANPDGTNVHYYVIANDLGGASDANPSDAPLHYYSYLVGPHIMINEVYLNGYDTLPLGADNSEYIELYNPTGGGVDVSGWTIENDKSDGVWAFPSLTTLANNGYFVIAKDSYYNDTLVGGYRNDAQLTAILPIPHFEIFAASDYDDPAVPNMVLAGGVNEDISLSDFSDNLILKNQYGTVVDCMEYGVDYSWIPGRTIPASPENCSLTRDILHTDTDDAMYDFTSTKAPTPGTNVGNRPVIHYVTRNPAAPESMEAVSVSARITCAVPVTTATVYYRIDGAAFLTAAMTNMGSNIWQGTIPGQANPSVVEYYIYAAFGGLYDTNPVDDPSDGEQNNDPNNYYTYTVQPHILITEVYYESNVWVNDAQDSKFIEIYNPDTSSVDISGWGLWGEPSFYTRDWTFPAGTTIDAGGVLVIAKTAGDASNTGFYTEFGFLPDLEMYDDTMTSESYTDYDNPAVTNLNLVIGSNFDDQIWLGTWDGSYYCDAVYLTNDLGMVIDCMEYGVEGEFVPGYPAEATEVGYSLHRDEFASDTDNSLVDFTSATPSPGYAITNFPAYDIDLTGRVAGDWAFISYPIDISGNIETILDDPITDWDVAKWWDASVQRWKTYRKGATTNTFTTINNQMSVWIHLTAVSGNKLTTGIGGLYPASQVSITLYVGWNMVGYPSQTSTAANLALAGTGATIVSVYTPTSPFIQDYTDLSAVTMEHGKAYWVWVPATITWNVPYP